MGAASTRRRDAFLRSVGGIEQCIYLSLGDERIDARAEGDIERTRKSDGKASAISRPAKFSAGARTKAAQCW